LRAKAAEFDGIEPHNANRYLAEPFLRDGHWLSNRVFTSAADIVDHCCYAWNQLVAQPWKIISIGLRSWAHGFSL